jgi:hypothetical protein
MDPPGSGVSVGAGGGGVGVSVGVVSGVWTMTGAAGIGSRVRFVVKTIIVNIAAIFKINPYRSALIVS